ncbi:TonB-dependent receptor plug domain-containing protein [Desulfothermus sp.]
MFKFNEKKIYLFSIYVILNFALYSIIWASSLDVIVLNRKDIKNMNGQTVYDILNRIPGINAGENFISIRGSLKVKVYLDDKPLNDPSSSHGGIKFDVISPEDIERIKIIKGQGAVGYGNDASGGVILIYTIKKRSLGGNIKYYTGNFNTHSFKTNLRHNIHNIGFNITGGYFSTNGYQTNSDKEKYRLGVKVDSRLHNNSTIAISYDFLNSRRGISGRVEYPTPNLRKKSYMHSLGINFSNYNLKTMTYINKAHTSYSDSSKRLHTFIDVTKGGARVTKGIKLPYLKNTIIGLEGESAIGKGSTFNRHEEYSMSCFMSSHNKIFNIKELSINYGVRGTLNSHFKDYMDPEIKLIYKKNKFLGTISYSRNHNTPSFYQRYNKTNKREPNPSLDVESADNICASGSYKINDNFSLNFSVFKNRIKNRIVYVLGHNGVGKYNNFGSVTYKGFDGLFKWKYKTIMGNVGYTHLEARDDKTGRWMVAKPKHKINLLINCKLKNNLSVVFDAKYESKQYTRTNNKTWVGARTIYNIRARYTLPKNRFINNKVEVFTEVKNLMNKHYLYGDGYLAPPRTWLFGINFYF